MPYELVYNSVSIPRDFPREALLHVLASARKRNLEYGVTGLLLYHDGEFVQLLEGERASVLKIYEDFIARDKYHTHAGICWEGEVDRRSFGAWSMGFAGDAETRDLDSLIGYVVPDVVCRARPVGASIGSNLLHAMFGQMRAGPAQLAASPRPTPGL
jgi:hypothetical protein